MQRIKLLLLFILIQYSVWSQSNIKAYSQIQKYHSFEEGNYIEIYSLISGKSIKYQKNNRELIGRVSIQYKISQADTIIYDFNDTILSPPVIDSIVNDFYDLKTIPLEPGNYKLEMVFQDLNNNKSNQTKLSTSIDIKNFEKNKPSISTLEIADGIYKTKNETLLTKFGHEITPHLGTYFSSECKYLPYYFEIYNPTADTTPIYLSRKIVDITNHITIEEDSVKINLYKTTPIFNAIDIRSLPTGEYELHFSITNRSGKKYDEVFIKFDRSNDVELVNIYNTTQILDPFFQQSISSDSLLYYAKSLYPIMYSEDQKSLNHLIKQQDTTKIRLFVQGFWKITAKNKNIFDTWIQYKQQVLAVEKLYKTINIHGYETDRGRVYLKYGPPTSVTTRETSPSEYPYEIWQYDKILKFANKRFVFYNPDIVGSNYRLLHSDLNGELKNYKWPGLLRKRNNSTINVDDPLEGGFDHFGGESTELYNQY